MIRRVFEFVKAIVKKCDKQTVFVSLGVLLILSYYLNPLDNVDVTEWNRTFCSAVLSGISIDRRIENFYLLFFVFLPLLFAFILITLSCVNKYRSSYKDYFTKYCILTVCVAIASLISRYSVGGYGIASNPALQTVIVFGILLLIIAVIDKNEEFNFSDIVLLFLTYVTVTLLLSMLFGLGGNTKRIVLISFVTIVIIVITSLKVVCFKKIKSKFRLILCFVMWLPALIRIELEIIYYLTERGHIIVDYFTSILSATIIIILIFVGVTFLLNKKEKDVTEFGYIGFLISLSIVAFFFIFVSIYMVI